MIDMHLAREVATFNRLRLYRNSIPRGASAWLDVAIELRGGEELRSLGGAKLGTIEAISLDRRMADIKKRKDSASIHPIAVFAHKHVKAQVKKA
jgi:hypothetical protein